MTENLLKLWCPLTKDIHGSFVGILSDTSLDRDEEMMSKELLYSWAEKKSLPALLDHKNSMDNLVGGWKDFQVVEKGDHAALIAKPFFFSKEANPKAAQIKKLVEEAIEHDIPVGISIGAIPKDSTTKKIGDKDYKVYTKAELVEATIVPVQSNRNASFVAVAKSFDYELVKPKEMEECIMALMNDPDFKPQEGRTKEESAHAVCQMKHKKSYSDNNREEIKKMVSEQVDIGTTEPNAIEKLADVKVETIKKESNEEIEAIKKELAEVKKTLESERKKAVLKATVEGPEASKASEIEVEPSIINLIKATYGIKN